MSDSTDTDQLVTTVASPITVLREQRGSRLDQALLLTFTLDLHYFERVALPTLRATGARVTVVGDAFASQQDPRAVRWAGKTYLAGHAAGVPAFHPKLILLLGPSHAIAAIGSGNLTASGWQRNEEMWTILRSRGGRAPAALADLTNWLLRLPDVVALGPGVGDALSSASEQLEGHLATTEATAGQTRILHNLHRPIFEQLPHGPTRQLGLSAPFHGPRATTLRALLERLTPDETTLVVQARNTRLDATATAAVLSQHGGKAEQDTQRERYRHGKLVEWVDATGERWALVGSPNLTAKALQHRTGPAGNCELAVLAPTAASLLPRGLPVDLSQCPTLPPESERGTEGWQLLGAMLQPDHVLIALAAPLESSAEIRVWPAGDTEERWLPAAPIHEGAEEYAIPVQGIDPELLVPSSRYRIATTGGDGETLSNVVFLTGPDALVGSSTTTPDPVSWEDVVHDPETLARLLDMIREAEEQLDLVPPASAQDSRASPGRSWSEQVRHWEDALGTALVRAVTTADTEQPVEAPTEEPVPNLDDLVPESTEDPDADQPDGEPSPDSDKGPETAPTTDEEKAKKRRDALQRRLYRHGVRWARIASTQPLVVRLIGLRFALHGLGYALNAPAAEVCAWLDWHDVVVQFTIAVGAGEVPVGSEEAAGSLVAVSLAVLDEWCRDSEDEEASLEAGERLTRARVAADYLTLAAGRELVAKHALDLRDKFGYVVDPDNVMSLVDRLVAPDPYHDAAERLYDLNLSIRVSGKVLFLSTDRPSPARRLALEAVGSVEDAHPVAAVATTSRARCLAVHQADQLLLVEQEQRGPVLWRLYHLAGPTAPPRQLLAGKGPDLGRWEIRRPGALTTPPAEAEALLSVVGMGAPDWR